MTKAIVEIVEPVSRPAQVIRFTDRMPLVDRMNRAVEAAQIGRSNMSIKDPATGISYDRRAVLPLNQWKMRTWLSGAQGGLLDSGGPYTVNFDSVSGDPTTGSAGFDTSGHFNTSTHGYTIPVTGYWQVNVAILIGAPANGAVLYQAWCGLHRLGDANFIAVGPTAYSYTQPTAALGCGLHDIAYLFSGDVLYVQVNPASSGVGNWTLDNIAYYTYWSMHLISG